MSPVSPPALNDGDNDGPLESPLESPASLVSALNAKQGQGKVRGKDQDGAAAIEAIRGRLPLADAADDDEGEEEEEEKLNASESENSAEEAETSQAGRAGGKESRGGKRHGKRGGASTVVFAADGEPMVPLKAFLASRPYLRGQHYKGMTPVAKVDQLDQDKDAGGSHLATPSSVGSAASWHPGAHSRDSVGSNEEEDDEDWEADGESGDEAEAGTMETPSPSGRKLSERDYWSLDSQDAAETG